MILQIREPAAPVSQAVALMVYHRGYIPTHPMERFLPDGGIELVIDLGDVPKHIFDETTRQPVATFREAWVSGMRTRPITISSGDGSAMLVVSFRPHAGAALFRLPMDALKDRVVPAGDVFGSSVDRLRDRLQHASAPAEVFAAAERWLADRLAEPDRSRLLAAHVATTIVDAPSMTTIDDVVRSTGLSHRRLLSVFREHIGLTPKQYQRVHRFQGVVRTVEAGRKVHWSALALDCGYYDQAHLVHEFREFSGLTPTAYLEARGPYLNYVPVD